MYACVPLVEGSGSPQRASMVRMSACFTFFLRTFFFTGYLLCVRRGMTCVQGCGSPQSARTLRMPACYAALASAISFTILVQCILAHCCIRARAYSQTTSTAQMACAVTSVSIDRFPGSSVFVTSINIKRINTHITKGPHRLCAVGKTRVDKTSTCARSPLCIHGEVTLRHIQTISRWSPWVLLCPPREASQETYRRSCSSHLTPCVSDLTGGLLHTVSSVMNVKCDGHTLHLDHESYIWEVSLHIQDI